jgi:hypothetical protein
MADELPEHVRRNRIAWDALAPEYEAMGRHGWETEPSWGIWSVPDAELRECLSWDNYPREGEHVEVTVTEPGVAGSYVVTAEGRCSP